MACVILCFLCVCLFSGLIVGTLLHFIIVCEGTTACCMLLLLFWECVIMVSLGNKGCYSIFTLNIIVNLFSDILLLHFLNLASNHIYMVGESRYYCSMCSLVHVYHWLFDSWVHSCLQHWLDPLKKIKKQVRSKKKLQYFTCSYLRKFVPLVLNESVVCLSLLWKKIYCQLQKLLQSHQ